MTRRLRWLNVRPSMDVAALAMMVAESAWNAIQSDAPPLSESRLFPRLWTVQFRFYVAYCPFSSKVKRGASARQSSDVLAHTLLTL
jgi:hypothetical protein